MEEYIDTIKDYNPIMEILDRESKSFTRILIFDSPLSFIKRYGKLTVLIYNKQTPIIIDHLNNDIIIRIVKIPNTNHKIVFKASKEVLDDLSEMWKINLAAEWDNIVKEIFDIVSKNN